MVPETRTRIRGGGGGEWKNKRRRDTLEISLEICALLGYDAASCGNCLLSSFYQGCTNPGRQFAVSTKFFLPWRLIFVGSQYETFFISSFWHLEF
jgi:hypothetical protein